MGSPEDLTGDDQKRRGSRRKLRVDSTGISVPKSSGDNASGGAGLNVPNG
jgi:hypothetical protein